VEAYFPLAGKKFNPMRNLKNEFAGEGRNSDESDLHVNRKKIEVGGERNFYSESLAAWSGELAVEIR
jgi:hypothetical protein